MPRLIFAGPFPPPVHGQSIATAYVLDRLRQDGIDVRAFDTGPGAHDSRLRRAQSHIAAALALAFDRAPHLYLSVNENNGMFATALLAAVARVRGKAITLHHHSARALVSDSPLFGLLARVAGPKAVHLAQGSNLAQGYQRQYGIADARSYSNIGLVAAPPAPRPPLADGRIRLGQLSNLTEAKGVGLAIATLESALADGLDAELVLAGPCSDDFAREAVERATRELAGRVTWLGPLYGEAKAQFFDRIDVFLFPTMHIPETQGIVNLEALSYGRPVIAYDRGCIAADLGPDVGLIVANGEDFPARAVSWLRQWLAAPQPAFDGARARFDALCQAHLAEHADLLARLGSRP